jgi:hypothetical protein
MKWLLIVAVSLAGLMVLIVAIGASLPQKHQVSRTIPIHRSAETAWNLIFRSANLASRRQQLPGTAAA